MRRPLRDDLSPPAHPRRLDPLRRLALATDDRLAGRDVSLQLKILVGYVVLGAALTALLLSTEHLEVGLRAGLAALLTLGSGVALPRFLARVTRLRVLSRSALEISRGDLSRPVVNEGGRVRDEVDELTSAINNMQENLRELVGHIHNTAQSVSESASELSRSAEHVNGATEEVASSMGKIAAGADAQSTLVTQASKVITAMAESIQHTAHSAEDSTRAAAATSSAAEEGSKAARLAGEKVRKVFSRIELASHEVFAFGEKTQEISKIVDVITQVAQQTNLLALNATIEAARAGEYGRGFAVVADEVRKLAESAGRSAEQISRLARDISHQSSAVVSAMKEGIAELAEGREDLTTIVKSMGAITDAARQGAEKVHLISAAAREQLEGREEMVAAIDEISHVARANASSTEAIQSVIHEQTAAVSRMTGASQELANLAVELQNVVRRFRLGG
ncbi:MAG: methyl-accepting chemotaxis protein [Myxococcaceae bacterium]|nr:methyl-accepting chemotaxis protein [Myxococcaceae bacterium]MCI0672084.1 methyl-accepting chemotaxis protein [Myxococcaceae bacterium]